MRKLTKMTLTAIVFLASVLALAFTASANIGGFSVDPIFTENQNPQTRGFFDVRVNPGERQELSINVSNSGDEDITVEISLNTVGTNRNGNIAYTTMGEADETMAFPFADIASLGIVGNEIMVPAGQTVTVPIYADIPAEGFDGVVLGSIVALLGITEEERAAAGMIVNRFANVVIVRLEGREVTGAPEFLLGDVAAGIVNHRGSVIAQVRNVRPMSVIGVEAAAQIYPVGSSDPIFARAGVSVDFAPNSIFNFSMVDQAGFGLHPGSYLARVQLEHDGMSWEFEQNFEILPQEAAAINETALNVQQQMPMGGAGGFSPLMMAAIGALAAICIAVAAIAVMKLKTSSKAAKNLDSSNKDFQQRMEQRMKELESENKQPDQTDKEKTLEKLQGMDKEELEQMLQQLQQQKNSNNDNLTS